MADGDWIFVSGTTGFDYRAMTISDDLVAQTEQCLRSIECALAQAGATLADVVRVTCIVPDAASFPQCRPVLRKHFGDQQLAATLADPRMKIEIEVTAPRRSTRRTDPYGMEAQGVR